ncbi:MAG: hypothetical protein ACRC5T_10720 [Cetobacterium sp.]
MRIAYQIITLANYFVGGWCISMGVRNFFEADVAYGVLLVFLGGINIVLAIRGTLRILRMRDRDRQVREATAELNRLMNELHTR